jgi:group I intron endonuclease
MLGGIYQIRNIVNDKIYVGSTSVSFKKRFKQHRNDLRKNKHRNFHLQNSWNIYGETNFAFEILEAIFDKNIILKEEQKYINFLLPEYNICKIVGSRLGIKHTKEAKQKVGNVHRGKVLSQETKRKISESVKLAISEEEKRKRRERRIGKKHSESVKRKIANSHIGIFPSEETKNKIRLSLKGKLSGEKCHKAKLNWSQVHKIREEYFLGNITQKELSEKYFVTQGTVGKILRNKTWIEG